MSSSSDGSNFRFFGNLQTSWTGCDLSSLAEEGVPPPLADVVVTLLLALTG